MKKTGQALVLAAAFLAMVPGLGAQQALATTPIHVTIDGQAQVYDQPPVILNSRTMVPLRGIFEALGAQIQWDAVTRTVTAVKGKTTVKLTIGSSTATKNGKSIALDQPAAMVNDRTLVPARFVAEAMRATVEWDATTSTVRIIRYPALVEAAENDDLAQVKSLLGSGTPVNQENFHGDTALSNAVFHGDLEMAKTLVGAGADVTHKDHDGDNAFTNAAYGGSLEMLKYVSSIRSFDVAYKNNYGMNALMLAAWQGHADVVTYLLAHGASAQLNVVDDKTHKTALVFAVENNQFDAAQALLQAQADASVKTATGQTALMIATSKHETQIMELLRNFGVTE